MAMAKTNESQEPEQIKPKEKVNPRPFLLNLKGCLATRIGLTRDPSWTEMSSLLEDGFVLAQCEGSFAVDGKFGKGSHSSD